MLHEAGHALGMSGFSLAETALGKLDGRSDYEMAHPTIYDSVMNYDGQLLGNLDPDGYLTDVTQP